jgi:hypothetical protein
MASPATQLAARCTEARCDIDFTLNFASPDQAHELLIDPCRRRRTDCNVHVAWLTPRGREVFAAMRDKLQAASLAAVYGCPGCADGPTYGVVLPTGPGLASSHHRYDPMNLTSVREALREAHTLLDGLRQAVEGCISNEWVEIVGTCEVLGEAGSPAR